MTGDDARDQTRDEIAESLADELFRRKYGRDEVPESFDQSRKAAEREAVDAVLASDVLAAYVATKQAEAWDEGFDAGERDVFEHERTSFDTPCITNPDRARAVREA